jgi:hypothetical protein
MFQWNLTVFKIQTKKMLLFLKHFFKSSSFMTICIYCHPIWTRMKAVYRSREKNDTSFDSIGVEEF